MPSRFNELLKPQEYVSTYVPLPLDLINQAGAAKQAKMDKTRAELSTETEPLAKYNVNASVKTYGPNGIQDQDLGFKDRQIELINNISKKRDALAERLASGKVDPNDIEVYQLHKEAIAAAAELSQYEEVAKQVQRSNEDFSKDKNYGKQNFLANNRLQYNTDFLNNLKSTGNVSAYNPSGVADYTNRSKEVSDYASKVGTEQLNSVISATSRPGYIYGYDKSGVTESKISKGFDGWYENSIVKDDIGLQINHEAALAGISQTDLDKIIRIDIPGKGVVETTNREYRENQLKTELLNQAKTQSTSDVKQTMSEDWKAKMDAQDLKDHPKATIFNETALTPGKPTDFAKISTSIKDIKSQIKSLPIEGSANDNYQTKSKRELLNKQLRIASNTMDVATTSYMTTKEGIANAKNIYKVQSSSNDGVFSIPEVKNYIKNEDDYIKFLRGDLKIPDNVKDKEVFQGGTETHDVFSSLTSISQNNLSKAVSDYTEKNPISYKANVLTSSTGSAVEEYNKELTKRVNDNGTNYYTPEGLDLNSWKKANSITSDDNVNVAGLDRKIGDQYAHYFTVTKKDGTHMEFPIFPRVGGEEDASYIGSKLIQENKTKGDKLSKDNVRRGKGMMAESQYGNQLSNDYIESEAKKARNNSGTSYTTGIVDENGKQKPFTINTPEATIEAFIKIKKVAGNDNFTLVNSKGDAIITNNATSDGSYGSIDDLKVDLAEHTGVFQISK